jgi:hypothetical protein
MTKILFLDFDGVLNSTHWAGQRPRRGLLPPESARQAVEEQRLDPSCVDRLKRLVHLTHASIVITSSWRQNMALSEMVKMFALYEFTDAPLISVTENLSCSRGIEVAAWLPRRRRRLCGTPAGADEYRFGLARIGCAGLSSYPGRHGQINARRPS